jgi:hypothetical protein
MKRLLIALVCTGLAGEAAAAAGRVDFATGGVTVSGRDGQARPLARGGDLDNGDTVRTNDGRAQIRFTDGSYVSLQPNTDFAISEYRYDGKTDGSERGFYGLIRGAMRTVTGAIGRVNRNAYRVSTPTATVGIRGTGGVIQVLNDGSTLIIGTSGIWSLTNPAGSIDVPAGISGVAPSEPGTPPRETNTQPQTGTAPVQAEFRQGDEVNPDGTATVVPSSEVPPPAPVLVSGPGYAAAAAVGFDGNSRLNSASAEAVFNASGQLIEVGLSSDSGTDVYRLAAGGTHAEFGTDGIVAWGRWVGDVQLPFCGGADCVRTFTANEGLHYVIGKPTPVMPTVGTATYSLQGGTSPTYADGSAAPGTFAGSLGINFGTRQVTGDFQLAIDGKGYQWQRTVTVDGSQFVMVNAPGTVTGSGGACSSECSATVRGFFAGANAERAGIGYSLRDGAAAAAGTKEIIGAAAFSRNP